MPNQLNQFFNDLNNRTSELNFGSMGAPAQGGVIRTDGDSGKSPVSVGPGVKPGFTPNDFYGPDPADTGGLDWVGPIGALDNFNSSNTILTDTNTRFDLNNAWTEDIGPMPTRNFYDIFGDSSTDFFKHGLHIDGRVPIQTQKDPLHTSDGSNAAPQNPYRLDSFIETPYENNDPVMFGFEIVIHGVTSPIFNGSVEEFISQFQYLKEVASRKDIISNFKHQFFKFFKSNTPITSVGSDIKSDRFYLGYYLKKISGLENLIESNTSEKNKSFVDYKKDVIKLSFTEDVSLSIGSLAYLYKLLYWSRINGKNIIPQNLLRFDCDIIITEVRNFKRVRKALNGGNGIEVLKDNLSRYVYSLYECQMFFDKMPHDGEINLGESPKVFDSYEMSFNYKFSSTRFEKWVPKYITDNSGDTNAKPDPKYSGGGQYSYLYNDRMDPFEISSKETTDNTLTDNGISSNADQPPIDILSSYYVSDPTTSGGRDSQNPESGAIPPPISPMEQFKMASKVAAINLAKNVERAVINQVNGAILVRAKILNDAIEKIRNSSGLGRMSDPTNVYAPMDNQSRFFYDIHNALRDALGETLSGALKSIPGK